MKFFILIFSTFIFACGGVEPDPDPIPEPIPTPTAESNIVQRPYCGNGICDSDWGEDEWWCTDCGYDPFIDGPKDGGYCGDGVCFGYETQRNCYKDCSPEPWHIPERDPGWIDPIRR